MVKAKANKLIFADAEKARNAITKDQQKQITKLYEQWAEEIGKTADRFAKKSNPSSALSEIYMRELQKQLVATRENLVKQIESTIKSGMQQIADNVIASNVKWLQGLGFPKSGLNAAFSYVPSDIVERLTTGKVYQSGWSLSKAIWGDSEKTMAEAYKVVAGGLAKQQSIYEIAKDLEKFVSPKAKKDWNLTDKDGRRIYPRKVDYAAQRLARTLAQHSYQQTFQETTKDNPFITKYRWNANGSRACEICKERDGKVYDKDKLPMDHPNGMCVMEPVTVSDEEMTKQLADWVNGEDGDFPEIDRFAKKFGYTPSIKKNVAKTTKTSSKPVSTAKKQTSTAKAQTVVQKVSTIAKKAKKVTYKTFENPEAAHEWTMENIYDELWWNSLDKIDQRAITWYTGHGYEDMNSYLRGMIDSITDKDMEAIKRVSDALSKTTIKENIVVTRGMGGDDAMTGLLNISTSELEQLLTDNPDGLVGLVMRENGFLSTTIDPKVNASFKSKYELKLNVPAGTHGAYIAPVTRFKDEHELLLDKGTAFRIESVKKLSGDKYRIFATVVQ